MEKISDVWIIRINQTFSLQDGKSKQYIQVKHTKDSTYKIGNHKINQFFVQKIDLSYDFLSCM